MPRTSQIIFGIILLFLIAGGYFAYRFYGGIKPAVLPPTKDIAAPSNQKDNLGLTLPSGFGISIFASGIPGARVIALDNKGSLWVSQTSEGLVSRFRVENGKAAAREVMFRSLKRPHGLAFHPDDPSLLYIAEEDKISRVRIDASELKLEKIASLPLGGRHFTRSLVFAKLNGKTALFVSIGSTCDVCFENDARNGSVMVMDPDGKNMRIFASGLRNAVFLTLDPKSGNVVVTEMGRDWLGDNAPPDEVNVLTREGENFGWPICYGNRIHDTSFDTRQYFRDPCADTVPPLIEIPAHSAPLGLLFMDGRWGSEYAGSLFVAYHGSWNRTVPTGYKIVRFKPAGDSFMAEDFATGWLKNGEATGRPVGLTLGPDGALYVSDDKAGVIYRIAKG